MMACSIWMQLFDELLNIRSCSELPDLVSYRKELTAAVQGRVTVAQLNSYASHLQRNLTSWLDFCCWISMCEKLLLSQQCCLTVFCSMLWQCDSSQPAAHTTFLTFTLIGEQFWQDSHTRYTIIPSELNIDVFGWIQLIYIVKLLRESSSRGTLWPIVSKDVQSFSLF